jgi:hypothetical protein
MRPLADRMGMHGWHMVRQKGIVSGTQIWLMTCTIYRQIIKGRTPAIDMLNHELLISSLN